MTARTRLEDALQAVAALADRAGSPREAAIARDVLKRLQADEWFVALLGETSAGKSSFANALIGQDLLPATADPTTGVSVELRFGDWDTPRFEAVQLDGSSEELSRDAFTARCREPAGARRLTVSWPAVQARPGCAPEALRGLVLVDAPGYNSCREEHTAVLAEVLPEADAVICLLNFRRGVTPEDEAFFDLIPQIAEDSPPPLLAVNWLPATGGDRQLANMTKAVQAHWPGAVLQPLRLDEGPGRPRPWNDSLWAHLVERFRTPARRREAQLHAAQIARLLLGRIEESLAIRARVNALHEEHVATVERALTDLDRAHAAALARIEAAQQRADRGIDEWHEATRVLIRKEATAAIAEGGRFTEARSCAAFVRDHLLPHQMRVGEDRLRSLLGEVTQDLGTQLDGLTQEVDRLEAQALRLERTPIEELVRDRLAAKGVEAAARKLFERYLARMGGAAGMKGGIINLSKRVVSRIAAVFDRSLSRRVYDAMGQTLKRLGISASRASGIIGTIVLEVAGYLYTTIRWKQKLRGAVDKALGFPPDLPLEDSLIRAVAFWRNGDSQPVLATLADQAKRHFGEAMDATRQAVDDNIHRRIEVMSEALQARREATAEDGVALQGSLEQAERITGTLIAIEGELV